MALSLTNFKWPLEVVSRAENLKIKGQLHLIILKFDPNNFNSGEVNEGFGVVEKKACNLFSIENEVKFSKFVASWFKI